MPNFGDEFHAWRSQRILFREMQMGLEETTLTAMTREKETKHNKSTMKEGVAKEKENRQDTSETNSNSTHTAMDCVKCVDMAIFLWWQTTMMTKCMRKKICEVKFYDSAKKSAMPLCLSVGKICKNQERKITLTRAYLVVQWLKLPIYEYRFRQSNRPKIPQQDFYSALQKYKNDEQNENQNAN